jgi:copper chaperone NosL
MAISEMRFAAEFITKDGDAMKFDDIGCMRDYISEKHSEGMIAAWYVSDYDTSTWLNARSASFVKSDRFKTPMGGGVVALKLNSRATELARENNTKVVAFDDVFR